MKVIRSIVTACALIEIIWLVFFFVPTLGVFRSLPDDQPVPMNGSALVVLEKGKLTNSLPLGWVTTGWSAVGKGWPLIVFGVMLGYPFGEYARRKFAIDTASQEAIKLGEEYARDAATREFHADMLLNEAQALHSDLPRLQEQLAEAQSRIRNLTSGEKFMMQEYGDLRRRKESVEKELEKARAKIRRLMEKDKRKIGKRVDEDLLSV
jgi:hypothetical protein